MKRLPVGLLVAAAIVFAGRLVSHAGPLSLAGLYLRGAGDSPSPAELLALLVVAAQTRAFLAIGSGLWRLRGEPRTTVLVTVAALALFSAFLVQLGTLLVSYVYMMFGDSAPHGRDTLLRIELVFAAIWPCALAAAALVQRPRHLVRAAITCGFAAVSVAWAGIGIAAEYGTDRAGFEADLAVVWSVLLCCVAVWWELPVRPRDDTARGLRHVAFGFVAYALAVVGGALAQRYVGRISDRYIPHAAWFSIAALTLAQSWIVFGAFAAGERGGRHWLVIPLALAGLTLTDAGAWRGLPDALVVAFIAAWPALLSAAVIAVVPRPPVVIAGIVIAVATAGVSIYFRDRGIGLEVDRWELAFKLAAWSIPLVGFAALAWHASTLVPPRAEAEERRLEDVFA